MQCTMETIPNSAIESGGVATTCTEFPLSSLRVLPLMPFFCSKLAHTENVMGYLSGQKEDMLVLKNKAPKVA
ncbi:hypothetical protein QJS10_CPA09g00962 [Acorus calamus]|uniref:Uncharacterized protein n=1 Tax=Acorus calamus TaxID=4465 RepID=A0AAV9E9G7_ACOCL|nr:hypothetical protein QJS10_CPB22g01416 [Acorus calamus]KAK1309504.1 hypothetical protein QJS10_CPA09g00962 [Acorus calamus]